ncbi:MAG: response regulator transcription factor [Acidobacteria bacterium]|nr:response regulator transcription factor [Acidobacteriota bacterium]MCI0719230.1 response regulator transcription factor [Acidobacteriota bacterium]
MKAIRVLLVDDHRLVRAGIRSLLEKVAAVNVVAEADNGREALQVVEKYQPDVVLMDIAMAGLNGVEAASRLSRDFPEIRVIILSMHATEEYVLRALRAGAAGYLLKDSATVELELAVQAVARGETYLSPAVSKHVINGYVKRISGKQSQDDPESGRQEELTARQREVLQLIAEGNTSKEIAQKLSLSAKTVEVHRLQLMERLDIHRLAGLVRYAIRIGLVTRNE